MTRRTARKERHTVTLDRALVEAGNEAVAAGLASSLSSWINLALVERAEKERKLRAMAEAIAEYEAEFGAFTPEELAAQARRDKRAAAAVRERVRRRLAKGRRRRAA